MWIGKNNSIAVVNTRSRERWRCNMLDKDKCTRLNKIKR